MTLIDRVIHRFMAGVLGIVFMGLITCSVVQVVPWYRFTNEPEIITEKYYSPNEFMNIKFNRIALIDVQARLVRELVRVDIDGNEYDIAKISERLDIDKGVRHIIAQWHLPDTSEAPNLIPNTYFWRGSITYKPFGMLEKTVKFTTNTFQIRY